MSIASRISSKVILAIIAILLALILAFGAVIVWAVFFRHDDDPGTLAPDFAPIETDKNATDIENDSTDKLEAPEGGGAVGLTYSDQVLVDLSEKSMALMFQNPGRSLNNMVLQVFVQDTLLAQSDLLIPGKQIRLMPVREDALKKLQPGGYQGKFVASIYNPETGEKNMLDAQVDITITVQE